MIGACCLCSNNQYMHAQFVAAVVQEIINTSSIVEFPNSIDPDEAAHDEPPHQDLQCLPSRSL